MPPILTASPELEAANRKVQDEILARCSNHGGAVGDGEPSTRCPCAIGAFHPVKKVSFSNIHGGTELAEVQASVKVVARWWDYETGWHFSGEVQSLTGPAISTFSPRLPTALPQCVRFSQFDLRK